VVPPFLLVRWHTQPRSASWCFGVVSGSYPGPLCLAHVFTQVFTELLLCTRQSASYCDTGSIPAWLLSVEEVLGLLLEGLGRLHGGMKQLFLLWGPWEPRWKGVEMVS
jgi:hypothetical protein